MKRNLRCDSKREKMSKSLNEKHAIRLQIDETIPQNQKNPKNSNGPCNIGPNDAKRNSNEEENKHSNNAIK